jgi:PII-like signaling protein
VNIPPLATLLSVYLNASDRLHGKAVYRRVVETARERHMAGASVFLVDFSYGTHRQIRDSRSDYLSFHIPVVVEIVDAPEKIGSFLSAADSMIDEGLVVSRPIRVIRYAGQTTPLERKDNVHSEQVAEAKVSRSSGVMKIEGEAQRLTIYIGNSDTWHGRNLVAAIIEKCRALGLAGATATVGTMGFGKNSRIHRAHLLGLSEDLPEKIEVVDRPEAIERVLPVLDEMVSGGLVVLEEVHVVQYRHEPDR